MKNKNINGELSSIIRKITSPIIELMSQYTNDKFIKISNAIEIQTSKYKKTNNNIIENKEEVKND